MIKRMRWILLAGLLCAGCCCDPQGPLPTEAGWLLFSYVDGQLDADREAVRRAAGLDAYCRSTTPEERAAVQPLFFPNERIEGGGGEWRIDTPTGCWRFWMQEAKLLDQPGALWRIALSEADSERSFTVQPQAAERWTIHAQGTDRRFEVTSVKQVCVQGSGAGLMLTFRSGHGTCRGRSTPRLHMAYTIEKPLTFAGQGGTPLYGGTLAIGAYNEAEAACETVGALYTGGDRVEITYCGITRVWDRYGPSWWR